MGFREASTITRFKSDNSVKRNVLKAAPGILYGITAHNINAAAAYLRLYNMATNAATSDTPVAEYAIPGATTGGRCDVSFGVNGIAFSTGIAYRIVTGNADNGDTACASNEVVINFEWA